MNCKKKIDVDKHHNMSNNAFIEMLNTFIKNLDYFLESPYVQSLSD